MAVPAEPVDEAGELLRSRRYIGLLLLAAVLGVPVSAVSYAFLALVEHLQRWMFTDLPRVLGHPVAPWWWPLPLVAVGGVLVGLTVRYLPGRGGHSPADGFHTGGAPTPAELPGVVLAALATLAFGAVLGPEAPLIALGGGLAAYAVHMARRDPPQQTLAVVSAAGSFAAISTLLGSPLLGAFLLMEASGLGGATLGLVLVPGLLAAGIGSLIFLGLGVLTGLGTYSLALPDLPHFVRPDAVEFAWAVGIGAAAAVVGTGIRWLGLVLRPWVERWVLWATPVVGVLVAGLAVGYAAATGRSAAEVLFSGQSEIGPLLAHAADYSVFALVLMMACKGLAYAVSLSAFRGGPIFPAMFLGAAGGLALSHLPGLALVAGVATGMGAMAVVMLRLPLTSVLLATLLLADDGLAAMPLVIVAVVVAHVLTARLGPAPSSGAEPRRGTERPADGSDG
jgi:H+/Cl- antiporter ClcA